MTVSQIIKDIKPFPTYSEAKDENLEWPKHRSEEYWEYRRKWSEIPKNMEVTKFPIHLDIETTSYCNLLCVMCPRTIMVKEKTGYLEDVELPMDLYKRIIDEGAQNGLCSVKLQYLGEPLADSKIVERIRYAKDKGILDIMINTNATLLTEEMSHKILEAGLDDIFFSIDSIDPTKYNKIRIGAEYYSVIDNIKKFLKIKEEGGYKHVQTRTSMVVLPGTKPEEIKRYLDFWKPLVGIVGFDEWVDHSSGHGEYEDYNPEFVCAMPFQRMFILYDGRCTACCVDSKRAYVIGDANKQTITEIWHGEKLTKLRNAHITGHYRDIDMCKQCYIPHSKSAGDSKFDKNMFNKSITKTS